MKNELNSNSNVEEKIIYIVAAIICGTIIAYVAYKLINSKLWNICIEKLLVILLSF